MTYDITYFISWFVDCFFDLFGSCIEILESFEFYGFNLFEFSLALIVATLFVTVFLPVVKAQNSYAKYGKERRKK